MQKIKPCLWFNGTAEEAVNYYLSVFKNGRIHAVSHYGEDQHQPAGTVLTIEFEIEGVQFTALNAGPEFTFSEAISFIVDCETQAEVDHLWDRLGSGGEYQECGWLKDRFGVTWQIVPRSVGEMLSNPQGGNIYAMMQSLLQMKKLDIAALEQAYRS